MTSRFLFPLFFTFCLLAGKKAAAQVGLCPPNLDFELGDFTNWVCRTGTVAAVNGVNKVTWLATGQVNGQHTIISRATGGTDLYGRFPVNCPNGSNYTVKLGNTSGGHQAESVSYTYAIPSDATVFSIIFNYAVVFQDPSHRPEEQPRFRARIIDLSAGSDIPCVTFDFTASATLPGFRQSAVDPTVYYKDWTPVTINLSSFAGKTILLEFVTSDCTFVQHFGYAYIDVNSTCNGAIQGNTICAGDQTSTLTAPFGFQDYKWYSDATFTTILSNTQTLTLTPPPTVGTVFPVIVEPYPGFGCKDTLYATISIANKPASNAGADQLVCKYQQVQIGAASASPLHTFSWTPGLQVSDANSPNPMAWTIAPGPNEFIVKTTDILTGCFSTDTVLVTSTTVDTSLAVSGKSNYCEGDATPGELTVSNSLATVQWYNGNTPIAGANGILYKPLASGTYWAQVKQNGCTDSTRQVAFVINPLPVADAGADAAVCINETKQIGVNPNADYDYSWTPAAQVNNPAIANPIVWPVTDVPQLFIVKTTNRNTGCIDLDTVVITGKIMDTSLSINGKIAYCEGDPAKGVLQVRNTLGAVQWYKDNAIVAGANGFNYIPVTTGSYWAQLQYNGCTDSTRTVAFNVHALPVADFNMSNDTACINNPVLNFTNKSVNAENAAMTYSWQFSDGNTDANTDVVKTFSVPGSYRLNLRATTNFGCEDISADSTIWIMPNIKTNFTWDSICINRAATFTNLTRENASPQVRYLWRLNDSPVPYLVKNPPQVLYANPGQMNVTLRAEALGCENYADSVIKVVQVNKAKQGIRYRTITIPQGGDAYIHVRDTVGKIYSWTPTIQLSRYNTQYTQFFATGDDVNYLIDITDLHTCVTTDSLRMQVLKKPGYYLPTAFTPNGDGLNDVAIPYLVGMKGLKSFTVFNRWGNRIFFSTKQNEGWDGRFNGTLQDIGVYVWVLEFYDANNKVVLEKGTIAIVK